MSPNLATDQLVVGLHIHTDQLVVDIRAVLEASDLEERDLEALVDNQTGLQPVQARPLVVDSLDIAVRAYLHHTHTHNQLHISWTQILTISFQLASSNYRRDVSSSCVKGDIAIQWERSKFDHSQNPNPLTDYDKTLHNWLCSRDEHVTQNLCKSVKRQHLGKCGKYKALSFLFFKLTYWSNPWVDFDAQLLKLRGIMQRYVFWGPHNGHQHLGVQISLKPSKLCMIVQFWAS